MNTLYLFLHEGDAITAERKTEQHRDGTPYQVLKLVLGGLELTIFPDNCNVPTLEEALRTLLQESPAELDPEQNPMLTLTVGDDGKVQCKCGAYLTKGVWPQCPSCGNPFALDLPPMPSESSEVGILRAAAAQLEGGAK